MLKKCRKRQSDDFISVLRKPSLQMRHYQLWKRVLHFYPHDIIGKCAGNLLREKYFAALSPQTFLPRTYHVLLGSNNRAHSATYRRRLSISSKNMATLPCKGQRNTNPRTKEIQ